jgi:hypothetical protein
MLAFLSDVGIIINMLINVAIVILLIAYLLDR